MLIILAEQILTINALFIASEFLAEESQDKFWDFVEANQDIENDHDGNFPAFDSIHMRMLVTSVPVRSIVFLVFFLSQAQIYPITS